jgi:hypothetical protein
VPPIFSFEPLLALERPATGREGGGGSLSLRNLLGLGTVALEERLPER